MNGVENNMVSNNKLNVGVITPPNELHKPVLYSHKEACRKSNMLLADIYQKEKENTFEKNHKTPLSVKISLALASIAAGWLTYKKVLKW